MKTETSFTYGIDTNILVYAFDSRDLHKKRIATKTLKDAFAGKYRLIFTNQVLAEFAVVAKNKLDPALTIDDIDKFFNIIKVNPYCKIINYTQENIVQASSLQGPFWDSLIAVTIGDQAIILTENTKHFKNARVQNPFKT